ncbi:OmpA family protein [Fibrobacter sp. UBA4309]|uniref:OmpA family protein n=1 Tax=Fibrobacter sp. UBA4309 TaxID=1946537 RepID=UPI0025B92B76|nr:OmpA family protein [Fibrobacter sp. UBA4309]
MKSYMLAFVLVLAAFSALQARSLAPNKTHAVLNVAYVNNDDEPHAHKKLVFVGQNHPKNKIVVSTDSYGETSFMIPREDSYTILCESLTGPFECGETPYVSLTASTGGITVVFDDTRAELNGVTFKAGSAELEESSFKVLDAAVIGLKKNPKARVEIEGHTSSEGDAMFNQRLSAERAYSVREYMIGRGIPEDRISATGYGSSQPKADNSTEAGRKKNRRIEIRVLNADEVEVSEK